MKVLWFSPTPSAYINTSDYSYFGGGWVESLQRAIENDKSIELAIAFFHCDSHYKVKQGNTTYYPIALREGKLRKVKNNIFLNRSDRAEVAYFHQVVNDFNPALIHIFGTEKSYGLLCNKVKIPIVLHIQGLLNPIYNSYFIPGMSKVDFLLNNNVSFLSIILNLHTLRLWKHACKREKLILSSCKYFLGRTNWDKELTSLYSPNSNYFYCSEILHEIFYQKKWRKKRNTPFIISTTISKVSYKGFDLVLKTAKLLKELTHFDFEWRVFGIFNYQSMENQTKINAKSVNVKYKGVLTSLDLCSELLDSDVFINTSYIDNSPNSVCEAQILGMPVISTNVGGIASLVEHEKNGILVPANDPWALCSCIKKMFNEPEYACRLGVNAHKIALSRHDRITIQKDLQKAYSLILDRSLESHED